MRHVQTVVMSTAIMIASFVMAACEQVSEQPAPHADQAEIVVGDRAPNFELPSAAGETVRLSDYRGDRPVLLYFSMGPG
jgi:cytochrome oxidase Cu insertion factor (SCO1/SenC/PrrC family)